MRGRKQRFSGGLWWLWLRLPALLVAMAVLLTPVWLVLRTWEAGPQLVELLFRAETLRVLLRTLLLVATVTVGSALIAMPLAWITVRCDVPLRRTWSVLTALPLVVPSYVGALAMIAALGPRGILAGWLQPLTGQATLPSIYGFFGAALTLSLLSYPYMLLSLRAGLRDLDASLEEASWSLGQGGWGTFRRVVLPQMAPSIAAGALLVALYTLSDFGAVSLLRYDTFTSVIYLQYQTSFDRSLAAGMSLVLVLMTLGILLLESLARGRARYYRASAGPGRIGRRSSGYRWLLMLLPAAVSLISLGIPLSVLTYWLVRGLAAGEQLGALWRPTVQSAGVAAASALVCLVAALPVAILAVRHADRVSRAIERASYIGFGLPGIVVALALVFFSTRLARPLYQTLPLLIFAYLVLFLPQAVGAIRASLVRIKPSIEEAGRSLGRTRWGVACTVTLPLLRSGIIAALALVFLTTMKELPATLVLGPIGFETLATKVWSATDNVYFARAAAPALLLVVVSAVPMGLLLWGQRQRT